jgi:hypothetical protein
MAGKWVEVERFAKCRFCGDCELAWLKSKSGKFYLVQARLRGHTIEGLSTAFHDCPGQQKKRQQPPPSSSAASGFGEYNDMVNKICNVGYQRLATKYHPDAGGSTRDMQRLNAAIELLRQFLKQPRN